MLDPPPPPHETGPSGGEAAPTSTAGSALSGADPDSRLQDAESSSPSDAFLRRVIHPSQPAEPAALVLAAPLRMAAGDTLAAGRYRIIRRLGEGGFGLVYEALDTHHGTRVALKTLRSAAPGMLFRLKQEFRAIAELVHPNLVRLFELHCDESPWFFTMELIAGPPADAYLSRGAASVSQGPPLPDARADRVVAEPADLPADYDALPLDARDTVRAAPSHADAQRLHSLFGQLAAALLFLHQAGYVHRDIKPSNILVTAEGRVVLLDFGLLAGVAVADQRLILSQGVSRGKITGTPHYMAPEQAQVGPVAPAADWYAFGVMLYQALCGQLPHDGPAWQVVRDKQEKDPVAPWLPGPEFPRELAQLCHELLAREPAQRPRGEQVVARLRAAAGTALPELPSTAPETDGFVGRRAELQRLATAFRGSRQGAITVLVSGSSGMGKSALCHEFLRELRADQPDLRLYTGRCFQQESSSYKAVDGLIYGISRHLRQMPAAEAELLLPRDSAALWRLFPGLKPMPTSEPAAGLAATADVTAMRRRGFQALRELLARLGARHPLVLFIDDLQWADGDSVALLAELVRPPGAPRMLLLCALRQEESEHGAGLRVLLPQLRAIAADLRELPLRPLSQAESRALLGARHQAPQPTMAAHLEELLTEAAGHPFLLHELLRHLAGQASLRASPGTGQPGRAPASLRELLSERTQQLPAQALRLLQVIACAGQPIERRCAVLAAAIPGDAQALLVHLRQQSLVRTHGLGDAVQIETYHDRIREAVYQALPAPLRQELHLRLAQTLEQHGGDAEILAVHLGQAGQHEAALVRSLQAASSAMDALAFARASRLYQQALHLLPAGDPRRPRISEQLGAALSACGRAREAAAAYLSALPAALPATALQKAAQPAPDPDKILELQRRAAEHLLLAGRAEEGMQVIRQVLQSVGIVLPGSPVRALVRMLPVLCALAVRGLRFRPRPPAQLPEARRQRLDAYDALVAILFTHDPWAGVYLHKRSLWLAWSLGEPSRLLRALGREVMLWGWRRFSMDPAPGSGEERLHRLALRLIEQVPLFQPHYEMFRGAALALRFRCADARVYLTRSEAALRERREGFHVDLDLVRIFLLNALIFAGDLREARQRAEEFRRDAQARGDRFLESSVLAQAGWIAGLCDDRPAAARQALDEAEAMWPPQHGLHHYARTASLTLTELYSCAGAGLAPLDVLERQWPALERSGIMRLHTGARVVALSLRILATLAAAADPRAEREAQLQEVETDLAKLGKLRLRPVQILQTYLQAALHLARGQHQAAKDLLPLAEAGFIQMGMGLFLPAIRRARAVLLGGEAGRLQVQQEDARQRALGIRVPARLFAMLLPGNALGSAYGLVSGSPNKPSLRPSSFR